MITYRTLIDDLAAGCKPKERFRIGLEHEQFAFSVRNGAPLPYDGEPGIRQLLEALAEADGWEIIREAGNPIALKKGDENVTLEPGGQFEFSGAPEKSVADAAAAMDRFYAVLESVADKLGIGFLQTGLHPQWRRADIHRMPKARYGIMAPYMETKGGHGLDMMLRSCGAQVNLDYGSEADMVRKFRLAMALSPVVTALMANSTMLEGRDTGYASYRSHVWTDTDPDRCGILPFVFEDGMGFARYVDYALDVPMYFIRRSGQYINVAGQSFRAFMEGALPGHEGQYPTMEDWQDHLTTLFPEVRLKHYLELRGADSGPPEMVYAMAAFWAGLFYDETAMTVAWSLVKDWSIDAHQRLRDDVPRLGLDAPTPGGRNLCTLAQDIIDILDRSAAETGFLTPFKAKISGCCNPRKAASG